MQSLAIPVSVTHIGGEAFQRCSSLTAIEVSESNPEYCSIDGALFTKDKRTMIAYPAGRSEEEYAIPAGVTSIGDDVFAGCSSLKSINIPNGVTEIGWGAFSGCSSLHSLEIPSSVTEIGWGAFGGCIALKSLDIPESVTLIGWEVFNGCSSLELVKLPDSVTEIGDDSFRDCPKLTLRVPKGSYAERFAIEMGIKYETF